MATFLPEVLKAALGMVESGGDSSARGYMHKNMKAPARGKYQITSNTAKGLVRSGPDLFGMKDEDMLDLIERDPELAEMFQNALMNDQKRTLSRIKPGLENSREAMSLLHRFGTKAVRQYANGTLNMDAAVTENEKETPNQYLGKINKAYGSKDAPMDKRSKSGIRYTTGTTGARGGFTDMSSNVRGSDLQGRQQPQSPPSSVRVVTDPNGTIRLINGAPGEGGIIDGVDREIPQQFRSSGAYMGDRPNENINSFSGQQGMLGYQQSPGDLGQSPSSGAYMGDRPNENLPSPVTSDTRPYEERMRPDASPYEWQGERPSPHQYPTAASPEMGPGWNDRYRPIGPGREPLDRSKRQDLLVGRASARADAARSAGKDKKADRLEAKVERINRRASQGKSSFLERAFGINRDSRPYRQEEWADHYDKRANERKMQSPQEHAAYSQYLQENDGPTGAGNYFWDPNEHVTGPRPPPNPYLDDSLRPR